MPVSTECAAALLSFRYPSNNNNNEILAACFTLRGLMTHISINCGFVSGRQDLPSDARALS